MAAVYFLWVCASPFILVGLVGVWIGGVAIVIEVNLGDDRLKRVKGKQ